MSTERWREVEELFRATVDRGDDEQAELLDRACAGNTELRREVESLLLAHRRAGRFMEDAVQAESRLLADPRVGSRVGDYELVRRLGQGGMGTVYLAERVDRRYRRQVAVKIIHPGADNEAIQRRFRQERRILASLDHPNIARLLDAAVTEDGLPCFVMEHADGVPIDEHCEAAGLGTGERLELFRTVCSAVQAAHRQLVVHRDIKPSNILVSQDGVPKLLDFGIAKLLDPESFPQTVVPTADTLRAMTPEYASPEQVRGETITTASDVYSLGVLLYRLLTGRPPYGVPTGHPRQIEEVICHQEPTKPSLAVGEGGGVDDADRRRLRRRLAGDLDNILLTALRKEPRRRYGSVEQLSEDLRRHLEGLPVLARKPTLAYRAGKLARRHRAAVGAAVLASFTLVAGLAGALWQAGVAIRERQRAEAERDRAEEVSRFLEELFLVPDPSVSRGNTVTARELLDRGAERLPDRLRHQPATRAKLMDTIGRSYQGLGLYDAAAELLEASLAIQLRELGEGHLAVAETRDNLGGLLYDKGDHEAAGAHLETALETRRHLLGDDHLLVAESLNNLAENLRAQGELETAEPLLRQALDLKRRRLGDRHADVATSLNNLAGLLAHRGDLQKAEALFREALETRQQLLDDNDPAVAESLNNLGVVLYRQNDFAAAEPLFREVLTRRRQLLGDDHPDVAQSLNNLATLLALREDPAAAEPLFRQALEIKRRRLGEEHPGLAVTLHGLGTVLGARGDADGAEEALRQALRLRREHDEDGAIAESALALGLQLLAGRRLVEAQALLREAVEIRRAALSAEDWRIAEAQSALAESLWAARLLDEAAALAGPATAALESALGADDPRSRRARERLELLDRALDRDSPGSAERRQPR